MARGSRRTVRRAEAAARLRAGEDSLRGPAGEQVEDGWVVRRVAGIAGDRSYRCPGCDHMHDAGQPHVVAWPQGSPQDRRHWHTPCWSARHRRAPDRERSRNAPRYG